jgi:O-antigen ligase
MSRSIYKGIIFVGLFSIPFIPFLVSGSLFFPYITGKAFAFRIIVEIILAAWLLLALTDKSYRPKLSPILYSLAAFLAVITLADLFGASPLKSFWSNWERMEGLITLLHLGAYFLVAGSFFKELDWKRWWNTSLCASFIMVLMAWRQVFEAEGYRVSGTFGNPTYLAVYLLLHIFIAALFLWRERKNKMLLWTYSLLVLSQVYILYNTGTRGAMLGLVGGVVVVALLNIRNRTDVGIRKASLATLALIFILAGGFWAMRNTAFVQSSPFLVRFANITTQELQSGGRSFVWPMAVEGVKERPLLGWGQENFNYVFSTHYDPAMHGLEPWFDRAHNIFLDWAVAGGIAGLLAYLSLYVMILYLLWRPSTGERDVEFTYIERSIVTGLVSAYFIHNLFVFDHLISYILFFSVLAYVHSTTVGRRVWEGFASNDFLNKTAMLALTILLVFSVYILNVRPISANASLIDALINMQVAGQTKSAALNLERAYDKSWLGRIEVVEQITINGVKILRSDMPVQDKNKFFEFARGAAVNLAEEFPRDVRIQTMTGSFLVATGKFSEAEMYLSRAKELSPKRQSIYFELGNMYINRKEYDLALNEFAQAYELAPDYLEARIIYLVGAIYADERGLERTLIDELEERKFIFEDRIISSYNAVGRKEDVIRILEKRIELDPANADKYRELINSIK